MLHLHSAQFVTSNSHVIRLLSSSFKVELDVACNGFYSLVAENILGRVVFRNWGPFETDKVFPTELSSRIIRPSMHNLVLLKRGPKANESGGGSR